MMGIVSYTFYHFAIGILGNKIATILTLILAVIVYAISVILLHVFSKEEIIRLPYGEKIYIFLKRTRIYRETWNPVEWTLAGDTITQTLRKSMT